MEALTQQALLAQKVLVVAMLEHKLENAVIVAVLTQWVLLVRRVRQGAMLEILVHNAASQIVKHNKKIQRTPPAPLISIVGHFNMDLLTANTGEFFSLHWQSQKLRDPPAWKKW